MTKCSFCEQPLVCKHCGRPFKPRRAETHQAVFQADMHLPCPECHAVLTCKACGYVYGEEEPESQSE